MAENYVKIVVLLFFGVFFTFYLNIDIFCLLLKESGAIRKCNATILKSIVNCIISH